jgi:outer membrane protein assembly factor BamB
MKTPPFGFRSRCALILLVFLFLAEMKGRIEARDLAGLTGAQAEAGEGTVLWHYADENRFLGSPALDDDGRFYIGNDAGILFCFSHDGEKLWEFEVGSVWEGAENFLVGTPVIGLDGTIYVGIGSVSLSGEIPRIDNLFGSLFAINRDGTFRWQFGETTVMAAPAIDAEGIIHFGSVKDGFVAVDRDGAARWEIPTGNGWDGEVRSSAALDLGGNIFFETLSHVGPDGGYIWRRSLGKGTSSSPALGSDGAIYVGQNSATSPGFPQSLFAFRRDGSVQWTFQTGAGIRSSPVIGMDGTIYFGSDDAWFYALDRDGSLKWKFETGGAVGGSAAIDVEGNIYFGSHDGNFYALAPDGTKLWDLALGGRIRSSPAIGPDGRVYIAADEGGVYVIKGKAGLAESPWPMMHQGPQRRGLSPVEPEAPSAPENLAASQGSLMGVVRLTWDPVSWAASYELRRNTKEELDGAEVLAAVVTGPAEFHDESARGGQTYFYWVKARNAAGESEFSAAASGYQEFESYEIPFSGGQSVSAPAISEDGTLYLAVNGSERRVAALDAAGVVLWEFPVPGVGRITEIALGANGNVYFGADRKLFALDREGNLNWEFTTANRIVNPPAVTVDQMILLAPLEGPLHALDAGGLELWRLKMNCSESSIPVVGPDGGIYVVAQNQIIAVSANGAVLWATPPQLPTAVIRTGVAVGEDGTIYAGAGFSGNLLQGWNPDGTLKWQVNVQMQLVGTPVIAEDGTIYFMSGRGGLIVVRPDGTLKKDWVLPEPGGILSLILGADGSIFLPTWSGRVVKLDSDFQFLGYFQIGQLSPGRFVSTLMLGPGGSLYAGTHEGKLFVSPRQTSLPEKGWPSVRRDPRNSGSAAKAQPAPSTPNGFEVAAGEPWAGMVRLNWEQLTTFARFEIWRNTVPELNGASSVAEISGVTTFDDRSAEPGVTYFYWLKAVNGAGESGTAGPVSGAAMAGARFLWETDLGARLRIPVLGLDGTIYVDDETGVLHAMDSSGERRWTYSGVIGSPAIHGEDFVVCRAGDGLIALDSEGNLKWEFPRRMGDIIGGGTLAAISRGGNIYWGGGAVFYAISSKGELQWSYEAPAGIHVSPVIGRDGAVYFATGPRETFEGKVLPMVHALSPDGSLRWTYSFESEPQESLAISEDGTLYVRTHDANYYALDQDGNLQPENMRGWGESGFPWWDLLPVSEGPAIAGDGTVFLEGGNQLLAFDSEGKPQWKYEGLPMANPSIRPRISPPILSENGTVYFTSQTRLYAVETSHPGAPDGWNMLRGNARKTGSVERSGAQLGMTIRIEGEGRLAIEFPSVEGAAYRMEISEDLKNWTLLEALPGNGATIVFRETIEAGIRRRFYRVQ